MVCFWRPLPVDGMIMRNHPGSVSELDNSPDIVTHPAEHSWPPVVCPVQPGKDRLAFFRHALGARNPPAHNLILSHWDNGFNSKSDTQILQALGKVGMENIIASGHRHTSQMTQGNGYTRLFVPSLNGESEYEKQKFIAKSNPWFVVMSIEDNGFKNLQFIWV